MGSDQSQPKACAPAPAPAPPTASTTSSKPPVCEHDVGTYKDLKKNSVVGDGFDVHHIPQKKPAEETIEGYTAREGVSIVVTKGQHRAIHTATKPLRSGEHTGTARDLLARGAMEARGGGIPNKAVQQVIALNKAQHPDAFAKKPGSGSGTSLNATYAKWDKFEVSDSDSDDDPTGGGAPGRPPAPAFLMNRTGELVRGGNNVSNLDPQVQRLLRADGSARAVEAELPDHITGKTIVVHTEEVAGMGKFSLTMRIVFSHTTTSTSTSTTGNQTTTTTTTTYHYNIISEWRDA